MTDDERDVVSGDPQVPALATHFIDEIFHTYSQPEFNPQPGFLFRQEDRGPVTLAGFSAEGRDLRSATQELVDALEHDANLRHPRYFGFIPGPAQSVSWLGDLIATAYNSHVGGWHLAPGASATEKQVIDWANAAVGLDRYPHSSGIIQSGGSLAALTGLTAARDAKEASEDWGRGSPI